jgi:hypothetical protein
MAKARKQLNVLIPTELKDRLEKLKRVSHIPVSTVTAHALREYLDKADKVGYMEFKVSPQKRLP